MSLLMADIVHRESGKEASVPVSQEGARLLKKFPYWRAYYFRIGMGMPKEAIKNAALKEAKEGDYQLRIMDKGIYIYEED